MAIALDAVTSYNTGTGNVASHTFAHTVSGTDRVLLVGVVTRNGSNPITSVTFNGVALTLVAAVTPSTNVRSELWQLVAPPTGTFNVVITPSGTSRMTGAARSYNGVDQTTPFGTAATASNASSTPATVDVTSAAGELVVDVVGVQNTAVTISVGAGQTQRYQDATTNATATNNVRAGGSDEPGATTVTMSWTLSAADDWAIVGVPLKPVGASGPTGQMAVTGAGLVAAVGTKNAVGGSSTSVAGDMVATAAKAGFGAMSISTDGLVTFEGVGGIPPPQGEAAVTGGGSFATLGRKQMSATLGISATATFQTSSSPGGEPLGRIEGATTVIGASEGASG